MCALGNHFQHEVHAHTGLARTQRAVMGLAGGLLALRASFPRPLLAIQVGWPS